ncbi:hypothetical protein BG015_005835, partial [Linnemannia schmuckeri]
MAEETIQRIARGIGFGLDYFYSLKAVYRDIKPDNILVTVSREARITNFGFAAMMDKEDKLTIGYTETDKPRTRLLRRALMTKKSTFVVQWDSPLHIDEEVFEEEGSETYTFTI